MFLKIFIFYCEQKFLSFSLEVTHLNSLINICYLIMALMINMIMFIIVADCWTRSCTWLKLINNCCDVELKTCFKKTTSATWQPNTRLYKTWPVSHQRLVLQYDHLMVTSQIKSRVKLKKFFTLLLISTLYRCSGYFGIQPEVHYIHYKINHVDYYLCLSTL